MGRLRVRIAETLTLVVLVTVGLLAAEVALRAAGFGPQVPPKPHSYKLEPPRQLWRLDPELGYRLTSGRLNVTVDGKYSFVKTHLDGTRITRPIVGYPGDDPRPKIWVLGCSYTYGGGGLSDWESAPWLLQSALPDYDVVNMAVNGYGTVQCLLRLRRESAEVEPPCAVILMYAHFHDERNTVSRHWRKHQWHVHPSLVLPQAKIDDNGDIRIATKRIARPDLPLIRYSAVMNLFDQLYDRIDRALADERAVTKRVIEEIVETCSRRNICLVIAGITDRVETRSMLDWCSRLNAHVIDIAVPKTPEYRLPFDPNHPNAKAARLYAERLAAFLKKTCLDESSVTACRNRTSTDAGKSLHAEPAR